MANQQKKTTTTATARPRHQRLSNYCWAEHPSGVRCTEPAGHEARYREHNDPYSNTRWT